MGGVVEGSLNVLFSWAHETCPSYELVLLENFPCWHNVLVPTRERGDEKTIYATRYAMLCLMPSLTVFMIRWVSCSNVLQY